MSEAQTVRQQGHLVVAVSWWRRWLPVAGLMLLSPFCAEYLVGYQGVIINPVALLVATLFVAPIYGAPAVLIREITRRTGRGWPTMLLLATAAGLIQAGLIDQSLFNHAQYGDGPPTVPIPVLDVDAVQLVTFIVGHIVWSFCSPIAVVESYVPDRARRPWLRIPELIAVAVIYLGGAIFFWYQLVYTLDFHASAAQLVIIGGAVVAATAIAFALPRRTAPATGQAPPAWLIGLVSLVLLLGYVLILDSWGWIGIVLGLILLALLGMILLGCSRRAGWGQLHVLAGAGGALMAYAIIAFWVNPEQVSTTELVLARGAVIAGVLVMLILAALRIRRASHNPEAGSSPVPRAGVPTRAGDDDR